MKILNVGKMPMVASLLLAIGLSAHADLIHRYSFTTDANDLAGTANGTLMGNAVIQGNAVVLDGSTDTYVDLPSNMLDGLTSATIEFWATIDANSAWARVFDFGNTVNGAGSHYLFFSTHNGGANASFVINNQDGNGGEQAAVLTGGLDSRTVHVAAVIDPPNSFIGFYVDGVLAASNTALTLPLSSVVNAHSYIGKSVWSDPLLKGSIDEFRIYNAALDATLVAASFAGGPDSTSLVTPPVIKDLTLGGVAYTNLGTFRAANSPASFHVTTTVGVNTTTGLVFKVDGLVKTPTITDGGAAATDFTVTYSDFPANAIHKVSLQAYDTEGRVSGVTTMVFDTMTESLYTIEAEDFNYSAGQFHEGNVVGEFLNAASKQGIDAYVATPNYQTLTNATTFEESDNHRYRYLDTNELATTEWIATAGPWPSQATAGQLSLDSYTRQKYVTTYATDPTAGLDYNVGWSQRGMWQNYTRTFDAGNYKVYARLSTGNAAGFVLNAYKVSGDTTKSNTQVTTLLGTFNTAATSGGWDIYKFYPLLDAMGNEIVVNLSGKTTLRTEVFSGGLNENYFMFVPVTVTGATPPVIARAIPAKDAVNVPPDGVISIVLANGANPIPTSSVKLFFNGTDVTAGSTITTVTGGVTVKYTSPTFLEKGSNYTITLVMGDGATTQTLYTNTWQYTTMRNVALMTAAMAKPLNTVSAANSGFSVRLLQTTGSADWANTVARTEQQLAGTFIDPAATVPAVPDVMAYATPSVINYNESLTQHGTFGNENLFPGFASGQPRNVAMEMVAYLKLNRGAYRFGIYSDDGFQVTTGVTPQDTNILIGTYLGYDTAYPMDVLVETNGIYPIRVIYMQGNGGWSIEFYYEDLDGNRTLINGTNSAGVVPVPAYRYCNAFPNPVTFAKTLQNQTVPAPLPATFSANSLYNTNTNSLVLVYQWYEKQVGQSTFTAIDPAVNATAQRPNLVLPLRMVPNSGDSYYCSVGLLGYPLTNTATATLTVFEDTTKPTVVSARYVDSTKIKVTFSEMPDSSATYTGNYLISGYTIYPQSVTDGTNVVIELDAPMTRTSYVLTIKNVADLSGNVMVETNVTVKLPVYAPGYVLDNYYLNIGNAVTVSTLTSNAKYTGNTPDEVWALSTTDGHYVDTLDNYGEKMYGYIIPSEEGDYKLAVSGDDNCDLYLSTDADPANAVLIATITGSAGWTAHLDWYKYLTNQPLAQISVPQHLLANTKYAFYALHKEGGGGNSLAVGWITPSQTDTNVHLIPSANLGVMLDPYGANITITQNPANASVLEYHTATFSVTATGSWAYGTNGFNYQWLLNGAPIAGATGTNYTTGEVLLTNNGDQYSVQVVYPNILTNTSTAATLEVLADTTAPKGLSAGSFAQTVGVRFDKNMNTNAGQATFTVTGGAVVTSVLWINRQSAVLFLDKAVTGAQTVSVAAKDLPGNTVTTNLTVGLITGLTAQDVGTNDTLNPEVTLPALTDPIVPGETYAFSGTDFDVKAGGTDIWNNGDNCHFDYKEINGDFDVKVRVKSLYASSRWAKAGLMARETLDSYSKAMNVIVGPLNVSTPDGNGRERVEALARLTATNAMADWAGGYMNNGQSTFPNAWVRLKRAGQTFTCYRSFDGIAWMKVAQATNDFVGSLFVGVCTTSHNNGLTNFTWAQYSDFGDVVNPQPWVNLAVNTNNLVAVRGENTGEIGRNAIDGTNSTKWSDTSPTSWIVVSLTNAATITKYALTSANDAAERDPASWTLRGSTDSNVWVVLDQKAKVASWHDRGDSAYFDIATPAAYQYYKLEVTNHTGATFQIAELGLWQVQTGDTNEPPELGIAKVVGQVTISWPESAGYQLYTTPVLGSGASWSVVTGDVVNGGVRSVTLPSTNPKAFYQLKK